MNRRGPIKPPSQRQDFRRLPVEGAGPQARRAAFTDGVLTGVGFTASALLLGYLLGLFA